MLSGRLGLESAHIPYKDRHGLMFIGKGQLFVENGTIKFITSGHRNLQSGEYDIPYQNITCLVVEPGCSVTHDVFRILANHGTGIIFTGDDCVRFYASMPHGADKSKLARTHCLLWANETERNRIIREMYAIRFGQELLPSLDINTLRGIEGARVKESYKMIAAQYGIVWSGRNFDRQNPGANDDINQSINHVSVAVVACAQIATAAVSAIPQLGFIHEDSRYAFCLDIADLFREEITLPVAFQSVKQFRTHTNKDVLETIARKNTGTILSKRKIVSKMIDYIKSLLQEK